MNILPQKSWHVRTKRNIERVRRDEAKAAEEEKEKQRRVALAEQEARTELLRKRARLRDDVESSPKSLEKFSLSESSSTEACKDLDGALVSGSQSVDTYTSSGHINFFKELEAGEVKEGKNKEHEEEKKAEKEKWEKDIGLLTYLGQSAVESRETPPWYLSKKEKEKNISDHVLKDEKLKRSLDPLNQMNAYLSKSKHKHKHEKEKLHKHKSKKKKKEKSSPKPEKHSSTSKTIEQLRAERLAREKQERQRALDLLSGGQSQRSKVEEEQVDERKRGYNSVFNPELVRKPKQRHSYEDHY